MEEDSEDSQEENLISSLLKHFIQGLTLAKSSDISLKKKFSTIRDIFSSILEMIKKVLKTKISELKYLFIWLSEALENYLRLSRNSPRMAHRDMVTFIGSKFTKIYRFAQRKFFENYDFESLRMLTKISEKISKNGFN
jgi:hypothetical protein